MKSILFTDEMVRSTLAGLKTKIRKPVKLQPDDDAKIMIGEMGVIKRGCLHRRFDKWWTCDSYRISLRSSGGSALGPRSIYFNRPE